MARPHGVDRDVLRARGDWSSRLSAIEGDIVRTRVDVQGHKDVGVKVIFIAPPLLGVSMGGGRHRDALVGTERPSNGAAFFNGATCGSVRAARWQVSPEERC